ncbi:NTP/NDP exchange transporter, partial [Alphaproteobacteria bacterium]|nr:NTP/NDP exchange transporter [Alphaproteobacteria bacterium]
MKKFLPTAFMMFFVIFNYTIMRNTKDAMVVPIVGPEIIPFVKGMILPLSIGLVILYTRLANLFTQSQVFYAGVVMFMTAFATFYFFLFPHRHIFLPDAETVALLQNTYPIFHHFFAIYKVWIYVFFYVFAELWGSIALQFLFWQFANDITRTEESKRFYPMYAFIGHLSLVAAGYVGIISCNFQRLFGSAGGDGCDIILDVVTWGFMIGAVCIILLRRWMERHILTNPFFYDAAASEARQEAKRVKLSFRESMQHVLSSPYLGMIVILILGYGISNNILGLLWKKQLQLAYPTRDAYQYFMGMFSMFTGVSTILLIFLFKGVIPRFGWYVAAMVTPVVLFVTGGIFFGFIFFDNILSPFTAYIGFTPLFLAVSVSTFQQVISKSAKYAMFDPTKEMAYIPLDEHLKTRGKAAADVIGHSLSKASGGYIIGAILMITLTKDLLDISHLLAGVVMTIIAIWIVAVRGLNKRYTALVQQRLHEQEKRTQSQATIKIG